MPTLEEIAAQKKSKRSMTLEEIAGIASSRPEPRTAADVAGYTQQDVEDLIQREVAANESLAEAKKQVLAGSIPIVAGMATAPFTAGMSLPLALGTQAAVGGAAEAARQAVAGEELQPGRIVGEAALGGAFEGVGRGVGWLAKTAARAHPVTIKPDDAMVFAAAQRAKAPLTANEISGGWFGRFIRRWADKSTFGEEIALQRQRDIAEGLEKYLSTSLDAISRPTSPTMTRGGTGKLAAHIRKGWDQTAGKMFDQARRLAPPGKIVDLTPVTGTAESLLARGDNLRDVMQRTLSELTPEEGVLKKFLDDAVKIEQSPLVTPSGQPFPATRRVESLSIEQATELRKLFNEKYYKYNSAGDREAARMMKSLGDSLDQTLVTAAGGPNSPYVKALRDAKQFYKEGFDLWDTTIMSELLNKNPSKTIKMVDVLDPQELKTLQTVFTKYGNYKSGMDLVRRQAIQDIVRRSSMTTAGEAVGPATDLLIRPAMLKRTLNDLDPAAKKIIFGTREGIEAETRLREYIAISERMDKARPGAGERLMSNLAMMAWGVAHQSGAMVGAAGASIWAPRLFATMANHPASSLHIERALRYAEKGFMNPKNPKWWPAYAQEAARAYAAVARTGEYLEMEEEAKQELVAVEEERQKKNIPQRRRPDR